MGMRVEGEPPYPTTKEELDVYCSVHASSKVFVYI